MPKGTQEAGKMTTSKDGKRSADTDLSFNDFTKESFLFQAPDQLREDMKLAKRLIEMEPDSGKIRSQVESLGEERAGFRKLALRHERDAQNIAPEQRKLRGAASSLAAQDLRNKGAGTDASGSLRSALRSAKTRQGIVNRGDNAIRNQRLKDRLTFARANIKRRASALDLQGAGQQIKAGVQLNAQQAADQVAGARAGAIGGAAGAAAGAIKERIKVRREAAAKPSSGGGGSDPSGGFNSLGG